MRKLLKHDIKETYLEITILNGLLLIFAFFSFIALRTQSIGILAVAISGFVLVLLAAGFILLHCIISSFHKKLFTDQGYLTMTTPVSIDKILLSKIIVNMMWITVTVVCVTFSVLLFISGIGAGLFPDMIEYVKNYPGLLATNIIMSGATFVVSSLLQITMLLFVLVLINIGRIKKHKLLMGFLIYIGISFAISLINPFAVNIERLIVGGSVISPTVDYIFSLIIPLVLSVVFYFLSRYFISNKLELE